jgi:hypothetical protein
MQLLKNLTKGLETIEPFLKGYGFDLDTYDIEKTPQGHFALAAYKNESKKFIIDYSFSIGQVLYQYDNAIASHTFYLDQLGFADKKLHKDFLSENQLAEFQHILHDFDYLLDDFFKGECNKLINISELTDNIITEVDRKSRKESSIQLERIRIEKARIEFRKKDLRKCLDIYKFVDNKNLIAELDNQIMAYCKRNM